MSTIKTANIQNPSAGSAAITIDTSSRVGIGTTATPSGSLIRLTVNGSSGGGLELVANNNGGGALAPSTGGGIEFYTHTGAVGSEIYTERARIDSSGRLLVNTTTGTSRLSIAGTADNANSEIQITATGVASGYIGANSNGLNIGTDTAGLVFKTGVTGGGSVGASGTERMRIDSAGNVLIRKTSAVYTGGGTWFETPTDPSTMPMYLHFCKSYSGQRDAVNFMYNGTRVGYIAFTDSATSYNTSSDYRLKENVEPVSDGIARLQQLKPSRFNFITDPDKTVDGFIAHEVQEVVPEAITGEKDAVDDDGNPIYQGIDQSKLVPLLTAALQEAVAKIESLEARLTAAGI